MPTLQRIWVMASLRVSGVNVMSRGHAAQLLFMTHSKTTAATIFKMAMEMAMAMVMAIMVTVI